MKARWWSESKQSWKDIDACHDVELRNMFRKLQRGDYHLPGGEVLGPMEQLELEAAFIAEFRRRALDDNGEPFVQGETS